MLSFCLPRCNSCSRHSEESTCPCGIVLRTPVSQDSTGLAVTLNEETMNFLIYFLTYPSSREQRERLVRKTTISLFSSQLRYSGTFHSGTFHSGTFHSGTFHSGTFRSGTFHSGTFHSGTFHFTFTC